MSQENLEIVRRIYEVSPSGQGNLALRELLDPDFEWIPDERFTLTEGPIRGRENVQSGCFEGLNESYAFLRGARRTIRPRGPSPGFRSRSRPR
jgi:ketosteroid isomerase-like protein